MSWAFVRFSEFRWDVIVPFVDIGGGGGGVVDFPWVNLSFHKIISRIISPLCIDSLNFSTRKPFISYGCQNCIFFILKVANIRCFRLMAVEIFHNIMPK